MKKCSDCGKAKPIRRFGKRCGTKIIWKQSICKSCMVKRTRLWRKKNRKRYNEYQVRYKLLHKK